MEDIYYPVKRRGEKRRLLPNRDAAQWLEQHTETDTEISEVVPDGNRLNTLVSYGRYKAKRNGMYTRRMFDIFGLDMSSAHMRDYPNPCAACYDFSRSWNCPEHPEVEYDTARRCWVRPGTPLQHERYPADSQGAAFILFTGVIRD